MKTLLSTALLLCVFTSTFATDYYFSSSSGDDARSVTQAKSSSTPWKTINKLNSIFSTLLPGDRVFFKRGDTFYGSIKPTKSGTSTNPIFIGAYGSGNKPIITGFVTLSGWVSKGGGIYESYNASLSTILNMITINNGIAPIGRYPNRNATNKGYLKFESHGTSSITDNELTASPSWTGGELVLRTHHWIIDRLKITGHSGGTISYTTKPTYTPINGYGYFIQNHIKTLDQFGEWSYSPSTKKVSMYFGSSSPSNYSIKASVIQDLAYIYNVNYLTFDNLSLMGANESSVDLYASTGTKVQNCDILFSGKTGVYAQNTTSLMVENSSILNTNSNAIDLTSNTDNTIIRNNLIKNSGVYAGMGPNGNHSNHGIRANGNNNLMEYNTIDSSGYCGIRFTGDNTNIRYNFIRNFCFVKDDGGGIYTGVTDGQERFGRKIINNIIMNGIGSKEGTTASSVQQVSGIYLDNNSSGITVTGNTVVDCGKVGLYVHNSYKINITQNTLYDNTAQGMVNHDDIVMAKVTNIVMKNNIFISKTPSQTVAYFYTRLSEMKSFGTIDSNYYARPLDDNQTIQTITGLYTSTQKIAKHTLDTWKPLYGHDYRSKKSPKTFSSTTNPDSYFRLEYNPTKNSKQVILDATYIDIKNKTYSGTISLPAYSSLVLIRTGAAQSPVPSSSPSVTITSPYANASYGAPASVHVTAAASVSGATISKVEFYSGSTLIKTESGAPYDWYWNNVPAGNYSITAKAFASNGTSTTSTAVPISVTSSGTSNPVITITSPTAGANYTGPASIVLTASASVSGSSIANVKFYKGGTWLTTETSAPYSWTWRNVSPGTYSIVAKATASNGSYTVSSPVLVTVSSSATVSYFDDMPVDSIEGSSINFRLYPNPAVNTIQIEFSELQDNEKVNVLITNAAGSTVKSLNRTVYGKIVNVDVSSLNTGAYMISVSSEKGTYSRTFMKN